MAEAIRVFYSAVEYETYLAAQKQQEFQRHIDEAKKRAQTPVRHSRTFTQRVSRTTEEVEQFIEDVLSGNDVRKQEAHASRLHRLIKPRVFGGGLPGLGRR